MRPFKPEPEKAESQGKLATLKRGAKRLGQDLGKGAKKVGRALEPPEDMDENQGPTLPGFEPPGERGERGREPYVPQMGGSRDTEEGEERGPYVPETLFDR